VGITDANDIDTLLIRAGARYKSSAGSVDPVDLRHRVRSRQRRMTSAATVATLLLVAAACLGVFVAASPTDDSGSTPIADRPAEDAMPFAVAAAPGTELFEIAGWKALAPRSWVVGDLASACSGGEAYMLSAPGTPAPALDAPTCEPSGSDSPALVVVTRTLTDPPITPPTTAVAGASSPRIAGGPGPDGYQTVHVLGNGPVAAELRRSATAPRAIRLPRGEVMDPVEAAQAAPGAPPLPDFRPGLPDGTGLSDISGSATAARFQLIDTTTTLRVRFITVCVDDSVEPGICSGDPNTPMEQRTPVTLDGVDWLCADPFACTSATRVDVDGRKRFVTVTVDGGLLTVEDIASILEWVPRD
jgi:hypothetical protein